METIAVIGAGTMGNGIAHVFALANYKVHIIDQNEKALSKAIKTITNNLDRQLKKGQITDLEKENCLANIQGDVFLAEGVKKASLVIEAVTENITVKQDIFKAVEQIASKECIIATNTSSISITAIANVLQHPERVIGMHFMNPVPVMELVEVIKGYHSSNESLNKVLNYCQAIHKTPIIVEDYPGFISNRVLMPMINEAIYSLYEGVAGVEEIDTIMKLGMNHPMGPLMLADFIGLDTCQSIMSVLEKGLKKERYAACPLLDTMVMAGDLGRKSGKGFYDWSDKKNSKVAHRFLTH